MKKLLALTIAFLLPYAALASENEPFSFRDGIMFGMSVEQVYAMEGIALGADCKNETGLLYRDQTVAGMPTTLVYRFENDELIDATYYFNEKHETDQEYIDDFHALKKGLVSKYGNQDERTSDQVWFREEYETDEKLADTPVSSGSSSFLASWSLPDVTIDLFLYGSKESCGISLSYTSAVYPTPNTTGL